MNVENKNKTVSKNSIEKTSDKPTVDNSNSDIDSPMSELMGSAPPEIQKFMSLIMKSGPAVRGPDHLLEKIPPEQASDALKDIISANEKELELEHSSRSSDRDYSEKQASRRFLMSMIFGIIGIIFVATISIMCIVLDKDELAKILLSGFVGLTAGGFGGYGLGKTRRR